MTRLQGSTPANQKRGKQIPQRTSEGLARTLPANGSFSEAEKTSHHDEVPVRKGDEGRKLG